MSNLPNYFPAGRRATGADLNNIIRATQSINDGPGQVQTKFSRVAIMDYGCGDTQVAQLRNSGRVARVDPSRINRNPEEDVKDILALDGPYPTESTGDTLIDINEAHNLTIAIYVGDIESKINGSEEKRVQRTYAFQSTPRMFFVRPSPIELRPFVWKYSLVPVVLRGDPEFTYDIEPIEDTYPSPDPTEAASLWRERKPACVDEGTDTLLEVAGYNLREIGNTSSKVYNGQIAIDECLTGVSPVHAYAIVRATLHSYPRHDGTDAGACWFFERDNDPITAG